MKNGVFYGIIGGIMALLVAAVLIMIPKNSIPSKYVSVDGSRIYYTGSATAKEAEDMALFLREIKYISADKKALIKLDKDAGGYIVSLIAGKKQLAEPLFGKTMMLIGQGVSIAVFNNSPVKVWACDERFRKVKEFKSF